MKAMIVRTNRPDVPETTPFPPSGIMWRCVAGDLCDPVADPDGWYGMEPPLILLRRTLKRAIPYVAWNLPTAGVAAVLLLLALTVMAAGIRFDLLSLRILAPAMVLIALYWSAARDRWRGYVGGKIYGLDGAPAYRRFIPEADCQPGSTAVCLSFRPFA